MTSSHPTVFRRKASKEPTPGSSFGLAPELARKARARVKWFAFAMVAMSLIGIGFNFVFLAVGTYEQQEFFRNVLILGTNAAKLQVADHLAWTGKGAVLRPHPRPTLVARGEL